LYDTEKSTYISLNQVTDIVKQGRLVKIVDAKTNEDITTFVLTQIVVEEARKKSILLPEPLLYLIIRYGETILPEFFDKYLELIIENYITYRNAFDDQFKNWLEMGIDFTTMAGKSAPGMTSFETFFDLFKVEKEKKKNP
jgi:polyhydroxyalkanoate synthesis repressor PhaR